MPTSTEEQGGCCAEGNDTTELYSRECETKGTGTIEDGDDQEKCHSHKAHGWEGDDDGTIGFFGHFICCLNLF